MRTNYIRCPDFEEAWKDAQERPGGVAKAVRKYGAFQVLVHATGSPVLAPLLPRSLHPEA